MKIQAHRIKELREVARVTQTDFAKAIGVSRSSVAMYEKGLREPGYETLEAIADFFNVDLEYLFGKQDVPNRYRDEANNRASEGKVFIPVYGHIAAGYPMDMEVDIDDYEEISAEMARQGEYMGLRIHGDSMEPKFSEGDVIIVRKQETCEDGDICAVAINGDNATCKRVKRMQEGILLISTNPAYEPMFFSNKQIEALPVRILGRVVELRAKF